MKRWDMMGLWDERTNQLDPIGAGCCNDPQYGGPGISWALSMDLSIEYYAGKWLMTLESYSTDRRA